MTTWRTQWSLDPEVTFLNHGSFGACPREVMKAQVVVRDELERQPVAFFRALLDRIEEARGRVAEFVGAQPDDLVFVRNATSGVNAVVASLALSPGDELLTTDHTYGACRNVLEHAARRSGAKVVVAKLPVPVASPDEVVERVLASVSGRTVFALLDHITSPTALVFPVAALARALAARGVTVMIDGAHAPGQLDLSVDGLDALGEAGVSYYAANFHKWTCAPKGSGCLWVRRDRHAGLHPAVISHGYRARPGKNRLHEEFDWCGTDDPSPWLVTPTAIDLVGQTHARGWPGLIEDNHRLAIAARDLLVTRLGVEVVAPEAMLGSMATVILPGRFEGTAFDDDPLQLELVDHHRIEVPIFGLPDGRRALRVSAHRYNSLPDYGRLADALVSLGLAGEGERPGT